MDDEFFSAYSKTTEKVDGVPGWEMNHPVVPKTKKGMIGIELELEASNVLPRDGFLEKIVGEKTKATWHGHADGSLRGNAMEYIVSSPLLREEVEPMLKGFFSVLQEYKTKLNNSNRCSTHVHINIGGRKFNEITSILALWGCFEEILIEFNGEDRVRNHFALSLQDADGTVGAWRTFLQTGETDWNRGLKYSALNILPIWDKGSLEFRCGKASDDADFPIMWSLFLHDLCEYAVTRYPNPERIAYDLSERGGWTIFNDLSKEFEPLQKFISDSYNPDTFDRFALQGFRNIQPIVLGFPWGRWMELIEKEYVPNPFETKAKKKSIRVGRRFEPMNLDQFVVGPDGRVRMRPDAPDVQQQDPPVIRGDLVEDIGLAQAVDLAQAGHLRVEPLPPGGRNRGPM